MTMETGWQIGKSLLDRLKYMMDNQLMCDVTFHVGPEKSPIKAHKYMLASASPVFYRMFEGPLSEKGVVDINDITPEHFNLMLQYIYTDKIVLDLKNIKELLYGSEKYILQNLKEKCSEFLKLSVNGDHACVVFHIANYFHMKQLETETLNFIFKNGRACFKSEDFLHLSSDCLKLILESDQLFCDETTIYLRMVQWSKLRCEEQSIPTTDENVRKYLGDLLYLIRFPLMTRKYFMDNISCTNLLTVEDRARVDDYFNDKQIDTFSSKHRRIPIRIERCEVDTNYTWDCGLADCIDFETSSNAALTSVLLFGSVYYFGSHDVSLKILHDSSVIAETETKLRSINGQEIYEILFYYAVEIVKEKRYTIQLNMKGSETFMGQKFIRKVKTTDDDFDVTFIKSPSSPNNTGETSGQIQGLLFLR